ncbi:MAG: O-antigen ligase family protein [Chloroflexota bacterium]
MIIIAIIVSIWSVIEISFWYNRYAILTSALQTLPNPQFAYRLSGNIFGYPNPLAGFLNFVWPIVLIRLINTKEVSRKILWGVGLALFSITILYTNSRGALIGAFAGMFVVIITILMDKGNFRKKKTDFPKIKTQNIIIIFASLFFLIILSLGVIWRTNFTGQSRLMNFSGRGTIWQYSWEALVESPIFGQGIAAFPISYTKFAQLPPGDFAPSAHNLWLQVGVDYGIIGLVFICILIIAFILFGIKKQWAEINIQPQFSLAYLAGGTAFLAHQVVDYMLVTTGYLVVFIIFLILSTRYALSIGEWKIKRKHYTTAGGVLISLIVLYQGLVSSEVIGYAEADLRANYANNEQWDLLQNQICSKLDRYPDNALYKFECSQAISQQLSQQHQNDEINLTLLEKALNFQQSGIDLNPYWPIQEANLAVLYWLKGDRLIALDHMKQAANAAQMHDLLWVNLGWMEEQLGNQESALLAYKHALRINPLIAKSAFLEQSSLMGKAIEELGEWAKSEHLWHDWYGSNRHDREKYNQDYWKGLIALSRGQIELAVEILEASTENRGVYIAPLHLAYAYELDGQANQAFGAAEDIELLKRNRIRDFGTPTDYSIIASILRRNGDFDLAYELFSETAKDIKTEIVYGEYYPSIYGEQILVSDISPWLIRSHMILMDTQDDWAWFAEEVFRREDIQLSEDLKTWYVQLQGISRLSE